MEHDHENCGPCDGDCENCDSHEKMINMLGGQDVVQRMLYELQFMKVMNMMSSLQKDIALGGTEFNEYLIERMTSAEMDKVFDNAAESFRQQHIDAENPPDIDAVLLDSKFLRDNIVRYLRDRNPEIEGFTNKSF